MCPMDGAEASSQAMAIMSTPTEGPIPTISVPGAPTWPLAADPVDTVAAVVLVPVPVLARAVAELAVARKIPTVRPIAGANKSPNKSRQVQISHLPFL